MQPEEQKTEKKQHDGEASAHALQQGADEVLQHSSATPRPPPPRLQSGAIPEFYDDEETGYQYYIDDNGEAQWDTYGYYDESLEYVYFDDVVEEEGTYVFGQEYRPLVSETEQAETISHIYSEPAEVKKEETEEERKARHRVAVIREIINTEKDYVRHLTILVEKYMHPLVANGLLSPQEKATIFSNVPSILGVNTQLMNSLLALNDQTGDDESGGSICSIFLTTAQYFKMYSTYCTNYPPASKYVTNLLSKNSAFEAFCKEVKDSSTDRLDLIDLLIKPVQRICKYPLLFRELLRNTDETHKDYEKLNEVMAKLQEVAEHVNESKRSAENLQEILEIANSLEGTPEGFALVQPNRRILLRDSLKIALNGAASKSFEVILFNDIILLMTKKLGIGKKKFSLKCLIYIELTLVHDSAVTESGEELPDQPDPQLELQSEGVDMIMEFKDVEEKKKWKQAMSTTKLHLQEEELKKNMNQQNRPRRRTGKTADAEGGQGGAVASGRPSLAESNLLKTVGGGGGLKRTAANIEAFRAKNLNSNTNSNSWGSLPPNDIVISEAETESAALEKLKKAVELEDEKREKVQKEIAELEETVESIRQQLAAQQERNAELEKAINDAKGKRN